MPWKDTTPCGSSSSMYSDSDVWFVAGVATLTPAIRKAGGVVRDGWWLVIGTAHDCERSDCASVE